MCIEAMPAPHRTLTFHRAGEHCRRVFLSYASRSRVAPHVLP
jgi:hypothetical protein